MFIKRPLNPTQIQNMTPNPEEIDSTLLRGVVNRSSVHLVDIAQVELKDHLILSSDVEFPFVVIGSEVAKTSSSNSFTVRVFVRFPTGDLMTLVEHLHIKAADCTVNPHVADWCKAKGTQQLELLANFISRYLGIEIENAPQNCLRFVVSATITQLHEGYPHVTSLSVTKPLQDIHGLFV